MNVVVERMPRAFSNLGVNARYVLGGGFWLGAAHVFGGVVRIAVAAFIAHMVDTAFFGQYQFIMTLLMVAMIFSLPGMNMSLLHAVARGYGGSLVECVNARIRASLLGSLFIYVFGLYFYVVQDELWMACIAASLLFPMFAAGRSMIQYYRGQEDFRRAAVYDMCVTSAGMGGVVVLFVLTKSLVFMTMGYALSIAFVFWTTYVRVRGSIAEPADRHAVKYGVQLTLMTSLKHLTPYVDKLLLTFFGGFEVLAQYSVAIMLTNYVGGGGRLNVPLLLPRLSKNRIGRTGVRKMFFCAFVLAALVAIVLAVLMPVVIPLLFSDKYVAAIPFAQLSLLYVVFFIPSTTLYAHYLARKDTKMLAMFNLGYGGVNIVLLSVLIPLFGALGGIVGKVLLGFLGCMFLTVCFFRKP